MSASTRRPVLGRITMAALLAVVAGAASASDLWLYSGRDFTGSFARISRSEANLSIGAARSIRVGTGVWDACTGPNFTGECRRLSPGDYRELGGRNGDTILSVRDVSYMSSPSGYAPPRIQLFSSVNFRGGTVALEQSDPDLDRDGRRFTAASAIVTGGTWEVCTQYNFGGRCQALPPGQYSDLGSQLNYRIVSVRALDATPPPRPPVPVPPPVQPQPPVQPPWTGERARIEVYAEPNFRGPAWTVDADMDNLRGTGFNDRIQSFRIYGGNWELCEDRDYGGDCQTFGPGDYRRLPPQLDRAISSMRRLNNDPNWGSITPGGQNYVVMDPNAPRSRHPVWLYEHVNFVGRTVRAVGDVPDLSRSGMNDAISSIFISFGNWQFCEDANYRGRCFTLGPGQYNDMPMGMNDSISSFRRVR